jgi:hypothetical protein
MIWGGWVAVAHAGAWTKSLGELYAKAGADYYTALRYEEPLDSEGSYLGQQYGVYAELGLLPGWKGQLAVSWPLVVGAHHTVYRDAFGSTEVRATTIRPGDLRLAAQVALHPELPLALSLDAKVPTYRNGTVGEGYPVYQRLFPKPGDGQVDLGAMLFAGLSPWEGGWAELGAGYVHRTELFVGWAPELALTDGLRFVARGGQAIGRVMPVLGLEGTLSPQPSLYTRSQVTLSLSALLQLAQGLALEPRVAGDLWTQHTSQGLGAGIGLSWRR